MAGLTHKSSQLERQMTHGGGRGPKISQKSVTLFLIWTATSKTQKFEVKACLRIILI